MKKYVKASKAGQVIFEDEYFEFMEVSGVGVQQTPWTGLKIRSKELALKHVVEIRLIKKGNPRYDGTPVYLEYSGCHIAHGMRSSIDTLDDTKEYVMVLEDAIDFAERVNDYLHRKFM